MKVIPTVLMVRHMVEHIIMGYMAAPFNFLLPDMVYTVLQEGPTTIMVYTVTAIFIQPEQTPKPAEDIELIIRMIPGICISSTLMCLLLI